MALLTKSPTKTIVIPQLRASTFTCRAPALSATTYSRPFTRATVPPLSVLNVMKRFPKAAKKFPLVLSLSLSLSVFLLMFRWQLDFKCVILNASALNAAAVAHRASSLVHVFPPSVYKEGFFFFSGRVCTGAGNFGSFATTFQSTGR